MSVFSGVWHRQSGVVVIVMVMMILSLFVVQTSAEETALANDVTNTSLAFQPNTCYERIPPKPSDITTDAEKDNYCSAAKVVIDKLGPISLTKKTKPVQIIDTFIFNGEFDMLDIRLMTMWEVVDYFVIVESSVAFSGKPKTLHFTEHKEKYAKFASKIHHYLYEFSSHENTSWEREHGVRNGLWNTERALKGLPLSDGDVILVSDADEIIEPHVLQLMKSCDGFPSLVGFHLKFFYYSFEYHMMKQNWNKPRGIVYNSKETLPSSEIARNKKEVNGIHNGGWHCSYCFAHVEDFVNKLKTFSHTELDQPEYTSHENVVKSVRDGIDIYHRYGYNLFRNTKQLHTPPFIQQQATCFMYLVDRKQWAKELPKEFQFP